MSPSPAPDPGLWVDAAISGALGVMAGFVKWLLDQDSQSLGCLVRHLIVAAATSYFAGLAIRDLIDSEGLRFATAGTAGYSGAHIWDWADRMIRKALRKV